MSQENLEVVQRFVDHWNETREPLWAEMDPEVVVFDEFQYELDELIDAGDAVLALSRIRARGVQSGAIGTQSGALLFRFSNGRIVLYRGYLRREEALEAVGLRE